jgi:hypothetical protein
VGPGGMGAWGGDGVARLFEQASGGAAFLVHR